MTVLCVSMYCVCRTFLKSATAYVCVTHRNNHLPVIQLRTDVEAAVAGTVTDRVLGHYLHLALTPS